jgi:DedD protein
LDAKLKQRVIGAIVMTTVAIIVLPMLLDGSAEHRAEVEATIPEPPAIPIKSLNVEQTRAKMEQMVAESTAKLPVLEPDTIEEPETAENFELNNNGLPVGWSLRMGSFKQEENARRLRQSLRDKNYRSYILAGDPSEDQFYRVYVGPMVNKDKLQQAKAEIEAAFDLTGQIVRYKIEDDRYQLDG